MPKHHLTELSTGERVVTERLPGVRSVALGFWIGAGSRDEPESRAGVSHFLEHLLFRGSSRYSAQEIAEIFDELGGELNAATSRETTLVYARVADTHLETAFDVIADMVYRPSFVDVDLEREVVLEEIAMVDDTPNDLVHDIAAEAVFGGHPLGRPVIGRAEVISTVSPRALASYHARSYAGAHIVVAAAGNVSHDQVSSLLEARASARAQGGRMRRRGIRRFPAPTIRFLEKETEQYHVCLAGPGIARSDERRYVAGVLDTILGGSASSRLFQEIREKRGLAYSVYSYASQYADTGQIGLYVGTREEHLAECMQIAVETLVALADGKIADDEFARAKENIKGRLFLTLESTTNRMTRLGQAIVSEMPVVPIPEIVRRIDAVTVGGVAELAAELLDPSRLSAAGIGPDESHFRAAVAHVNPLLSEAA